MSVTFDDLGVPADLVSTLKARGIRTPFPIQALTVADGCAGRDLCGRAPTGSGKTLAFGIPLVARGPRRQAEATARARAGADPRAGRAGAPASSSGSGMVAGSASPPSTAVPASVPSSRRCGAASMSSSPARAGSPI